MAIKHTMFEEFSYLGHWWVPGEDKKFCGRVTFKPEAGIELELLADMGDFGPKPYSSISVELLQGEVPEHPHRITLLGEMRLGGTFAMSNVPTKMIRYCPQIDCLLVGQRYNSEEDITFKSVLVTYTSLRGWIWSKPAYTLEGDLDSELILTYKELVTSREISVPSIASKIVLLEGNSSSMDASTHRLEREGFIRIEPESPGSPKSLKWFRNQIDSIRKLLAFLAWVPVETKSIRGTQANPDTKHESVDIFHRVRPPKEDAVYGFKMLFPLARLDDRVPDVFNAWFGLSEDDRVPFILCLNVINSEGNYPILDFLALVNALESYHRLTFNGDPGLEGRLKQLRKTHPEYLRNALQLSDEFLKSVADSRNYYSHYEPEIRKEKEILEGDHLDDAIRLLTPFIVYHLALKLTVSEKAIEDGFAFDL